MAPEKSRFSRLDPEKFSRPAGEEPKARTSTRLVEYLLFAVFGILIILAAIALYTSYSPKHRLVPNLVDDGIKKDRVNVLLIGIGGDTHIGGGKDLADTVIFASLKPSTQQVALISIPRDLYVETSVRTGRITGAYNDGPATLVQAVQEALALPIHHYVEIDFFGF